MRQFLRQHGIQEWLADTELRDKVLRHLTLAASNTEAAVVRPLLDLLQGKGLPQRKCKVQAAADVAGAAAKGEQGLAFVGTVQALTVVQQPAVQFFSSKIAQRSEGTWTANKDAGMRQLSLYDLRLAARGAGLFSMLLAAGIHNCPYGGELLQQVQQQLKLEYQQQQAAAAATAKGRRVMPAGSTMSASDSKVSALLHGLEERL
jgi:hypothetical protein